MRSIIQNSFERAIARGVIALSNFGESQSLEMDEMRKRSENGLERWGENLEEFVKMGAK